MNQIKLTQFSHGAGCGCKIAPSVLERILKHNEEYNNAKLLVGNHSRDDAAVYLLENGKALISTTDFFMPIVDDPYDFGRIASVNAISDVYAMGGTPMLAIAILGWPIEKIAPEVAQKVLEGSRAVCKEAGVSLAGGHSIDSPEPIFGLAVNGLVDIQHLKKNNTAKVGDYLFLTKPIGIGILSTAIKRGIIKKDDIELAIETMCRLNSIGIELGKLKGVHAMTDVTGFGLLGHLLEMAEGSGLSAEINFADIPFIRELDFYLEKNCIPGGTARNWNSYGNKVSAIQEKTRQLLADPQTSGGLLVAVDADTVQDYLEVVKKFNINTISSKPIGKIISKEETVVKVIE